MNRTAIIIAALLSTTGAAWACPPKPGEVYCIDEQGEIQPPLPPGRMIYSTTSDIRALCPDRHMVNHLCTIEHGNKESAK